MQTRTPTHAVVAIGGARRRARRTIARSLLASPAVNRIAKSILGVLIVGLASAGAAAFAWQTKENADALHASAQACDAKIAECSHARDLEREPKDKTEEGATAALNASRAELEELRAEH